MGECLGFRTLLFVWMTSGRLPFTACPYIFSFPVLTWRILRSLATADEIVGVDSVSNNIYQLKFTSEEGIMAHFLTLAQSQNVVQHYLGTLHHRGPYCCREF